MRIKSLIYFICFISTFGNTIEVSKVIQYFDEDSSFIKINRLETEKLQKEELGMKQNRSQKVDYKGEVFKESSSDREITRNYDDVEKGQLSLVYDDLYYESIYEFEESNDYIDKGKGFKENRIGIRKTLNDLIYSEKDFEKNYILIKKKILSNEQTYIYIVQVDKVIDYFKDILMIQESIEIDKESLSEYQELYNIAIEKEKFGEGLKLETDYLEVEVMEVEERLNYSNELRKVKIFQLEEAIGRSLDKNKLFGLFPTTKMLEIKVNDYDLRKSKEEIEMTKEKIKLKKRNEQTELTLGGDYDTERKLWSMRVTLNGSLFDYNLDSSLAESDTLIFTEEVRSLEGTEKVELKNLVEDYKHLKNNLKIKKLKKKNREKTVEVAKEMYRLGYITVKKFIDEKTDFREAKLEYLEVLNNLGAFEYKMYMRERVEEIDMMDF